MEDCPSDANNQIIVLQELWRNERSLNKELCFGLVASEKTPQGQVKTLSAGKEHKVELHGNKSGGAHINNRRFFDRRFNYLHLQQRSDVICSKYCIKTFCRGLSRYRFIILMVCSPEQTLKLRVTSKIQTVLNYLFTSVCCLCEFSTVREDKRNPYLLDNIAQSWGYMCSSSSKPAESSSEDQRSDFFSSNEEKLKPGRPPYPPPYLYTPIPHERVRLKNWHLRCG